MDSSHKTDCNQLLENIQRSLHLCCNNKTEYETPRTIHVDKCEDIQYYFKSFHATKTELIVPRVIHSTYSVEYNVQTKILEIKTPALRPIRVNIAHGF